MDRCLACRGRFRGGAVRAAGSGGRDRRKAPHDDRGNAFQFTPGAWSSYYIHDRAKKENYRMYMAALERLTRDGKPCARMEVGVRPEKDPSVVTRFLVEET